MIAVRPWSFPASAMPIIVTLAYLSWKGLSPDLWTGLYAIVNIIIFHASGNTWSDYKDFKSGIDNKDTYGVHTLTSGMFRPEEIKRLGIVLFCIAVAMGIGLMFMTGLPLLWIGLGGALCTLLYPILKYNALGDLVIILAYAFLPTIGTSFIALGYIDWSVLLIALPLGLITDGILHTNNTRDMPTDREANIKTLPMIIGHKASAIMYFTEMMVPYIWIGILSMLHILPLWTVIIFMTFPVAIANGRKMMKSLKNGMGIIHDLDVSTAHLQLLFSTLLALSFIIAQWL